MYVCLFIVIIDQFLNFYDHITTIGRSTHVRIRNIGNIRNLLSYNVRTTIIRALISYCNSILHIVPTHKTDRLQTMKNQFIIPVLKTYIDSKLKIESH